MPTPQPGAGADPTRRALLAAPGAVAALATLGGCSTYGGSQPQPVGSEPVGPPALAALADVPVGGGTILGDEGIVLTQPAAGTVKAFSSTCTHAGCQVKEVSGGTINCTCHNSRFRIADGSVAGGPAPRPLPPVAVALDGENIVRA